jgi:hypothetical protein
LLHPIVNERWRQEPVVMASVISDQAVDAIGWSADLALG